MLLLLVEPQVSFPIWDSLQVPNKQRRNEFVTSSPCQFRVLGQKPISVESVHPGSNDAQTKKKMTHPSAINLFLIFECRFLIPLYY